MEHGGFAYTDFVRGFSQINRNYSATALVGGLFNFNRNAELRYADVVRGFSRFT